MKPSETPREVEKVLETIPEAPIAPSKFRERDMAYLPSEMRTVRDYIYKLQRALSEANRRLELEIGDSPAKQAAFDAFYAACRHELPHNPDGSHSGTFAHALMCGIQAYLRTRPDSQEGK